MAGGIFVPKINKLHRYNRSEEVIHVKVKVKVVHDFYDKEADLKLRKKGTALEVTKERAAHLQGMGLVKPVEVKAKTEDA